VLDALDEIKGGDDYERGAEAAVTIGLAGAVGAAVTGMTDWEHLDSQPRRVGLLHGMLNTTAALLYARSLRLCKRCQRRAGRGFALLGYTVSMAAAYLGGKLVYEDRIGVNRAKEHLPANPAPAEFIPVLPEAELPENVLRRIEVEGAPILLVRRGARVFALAETCSHLSGPLAEGQLEGESVVCPWHGSRFALMDGQVLNGPATHPQPCFVSRVRNGQIEIRLSAQTPVSGEPSHGQLP
jgi:nitrite reductase/ring-hydroxylating ferredoxin subunit